MTKTGWRSKTHLVGRRVDGLGDGDGRLFGGNLGFGHGLWVEGSGRRAGFASASRVRAFDRAGGKNRAESRRAIELERDACPGRVPSRTRGFGPGEDA